MGTAVPLEAQEGNKYILTLIMKAFVAIAANPIEATPYGAIYRCMMYTNVYRCIQKYGAPASDDPVAHPFAKRHANEPDVYDYDYYGAGHGAAPYQQYRLTKRGAYEENDYTAPALTKRAVVPAYEDVDPVHEEIGHRLTKRGCLGGSSK